MCMCTGVSVTSLDFHNHLMRQRRQWMVPVAQQLRDEGTSPKVTDGGPEAQGEGQSLRRGQRNSPPHYLVHRGEQRQGGKRRKQIRDQRRSRGRLEEPQSMDTLKKKKNPQKSKTPIQAEVGSL